MKRAIQAGVVRGLAALLLAALAAPVSAQQGDSQGERPRVREAGVVIGALPPGPLNAITDVEGIRVGHATLREGDSMRTGVTAILPHDGDLFHRPVPAAIEVGNGFGKLVGSTQVNELGEIETPILLTGTLSVFRAADALLDTLLATPSHRDVVSINPVVGETNDGWLSDVRARPVGPEQVRRALRTAMSGPVEEGSVGAGTGTRALGWKGGIGTSSRRVYTRDGSWTVGVLVQSNYGGDLRVAGVPVWRELPEDGYTTPERREDGQGKGVPGEGGAGGDGSVMIVVATDAPLAHNQLRRLARRAFLGIGRTGSWMSHGSGDYAIAFSTRIRVEGETRLRGGGALSALFRATVEATEEAALNSLFRATTVTGYRGRTAEALPLDRVLEILDRHGVLRGAAGSSPNGGADG